MRQIVAAVIATFLTLVVSTVYADPPQKPSLWIRELTTDLCHESPYGAGLVFFSCQGGFGLDLVSVDNKRELEISEAFLSSGETAAHKAVATRFALLAGKFMGRVDAAVLGHWRLRFIVILK